MRHRDASSSECPRHHHRELFSPECATVRSSSLSHDDIRTCIAQRVRPPPRVPEEERLLCASDKVCARKWARHNARRLVTPARRGAEDCTVGMWMPKPKGEGQLSTRVYRRPALVPLKGLLVCIHDVSGQTMSAPQPALRKCPRPPSEWDQETEPYIN